MNNISGDKRSDEQSDVKNVESTAEEASTNKTLVNDSAAENIATNNAELPQPEPEHSSNVLIRALRSLWRSIALRRVILKALTLIYALMIFGYAYLHMSAHRSVLSYMGVMLLMVIVYAEMLVIRDHLWVIEGSMRESRRWRDIFFNQTSLRRQRVRKFISILFAMGIFSYMYFKAGSAHKPVLSFMGIMLMMTVLYYEVLTIRDEIFVIGQSVMPCSDDECDKRKQHYDEFIKQAESDGESSEQQAETKKQKD